MRQSNEIKPIFIAGSERSGTTLLRLMLHAHPRIAIPPQTKYLRKLYKRRLLFGNLQKKKNREKLAVWFFDHFDKSTKMNDLEIDQDSVRKGVLESKSLGAALAVPWICYAKKHGKERWGDKRPYYIHHMEKLRQLYPDAQIIHLIRDSRDVIASLKKMPWWNNSLNYSAFNWKLAIRHGINARMNTKLDEYLELRYEDLLAEPERELQRVCQFLGETYDPAMLQFQKISHQTVPEYKMDWHSATREPLNTSSIGRWDKDLSKEEVSIVEWATGKEMVQLGYTLSEAQEPNFQLRNRYETEARTFKTKQRRLEMTDSIFSFFYRWETDYRMG